MIAFAFFFIPEYKGKSLEQLDFLFEERTPTRKFKNYRFADDLLAHGGVVDAVNLETDKEKELEGAQ